MEMKVLGFLIFSTGYPKNHLYIYIYSFKVMQLLFHKKYTLIIPQKVYTYYRRALAFSDCLDIEILCLNNSKL